jgi:cell volume regulation protein A
MELETITAFVAIGSIIFIGFFGNVFFNRYKIPDVLILIILGMVIGPDILGNRFRLVTDQTMLDLDTFKDLFLSAALVIILFDGGLSLDVRTVFESMRLSAFMSVLTFIVEMVAIAAMLHFIMDIDFMVSLVLGSIVGGTTGVVVIPLANKMRIRPQTKAMLIMESVITDVLVIVTTLTIISVIQIGEVSLLAVTRELAVKFLVGGGVGLVAGILWLFVLEKLHNQPLSYMITVAALFLVAGLVEVPPISSSGAVAALLFGLVIGNRKFMRNRLSSLSLTTLTEEHIHHFHTEITFFVRTFFFVYLGMSFRFGTFTDVHLVAGLLVISIIVLARRITSLMTWKIGDMEKEEANAVFSMMPKGLSAAVLATLPAVALAGAAVWHDDYGPLFLNVTLLVILGTTALATIFSFATEKGIDQRNRRAVRKRLME